ncbi:DsbA family oxidoreductase [Ornithinibacillus bavariensis]|uniref:DSBA oxidoreductase n=1 Tax=Ornithinibacillus bavariensis TaxID=545502 RepID=A0A919X7C4_9BACI|nr:DsbA family oxidoreductase [Ornithinibacillus bavariensis]GIO25890.1 DSBA oxidoreductase [Ornithinibacillus bavariensis]HAM79708.1 disulfide bond formation protein DsbA [Ornithinibacillus sp.]
MKIEIWSDFVCPFCYIGKRRLEHALEQFPYRDKVELEYRSFELDPNAAIYSGKSIHEALANKYGMSLDEARQANENVGQQAKTVGLDYDFDGMKPTNTFDAHRLAKYASTVGKEKEITESLLHAYFVEAKLISNHDTLLEIAESVGLDREMTLSVLKDTDRFATEVRNEEMQAQAFGATGVPFFVINQKYAISGAQPTELFLSALNQVWEEEAPKPKLQSLVEDESNMVCTDEGCIIPPEK